MKYGHLTKSLWLGIALVGCGGDVQDALADKVKNNNVVLVEKSSQKEINQIQEALQKRGVKNLEMHNVSSGDTCQSLGYANQVASSNSQAKSYINASNNFSCISLQRNSGQLTKAFLYKQAPLQSIAIIKNANKGFIDSIGERLTKEGIAYEVSDLGKLTTCKDFGFETQAPKPDYLNMSSIAVQYFQDDDLPSCTEGKPDTGSLFEGTLSKIIQYDPVSHSPLEAILPRNFQGTRSLLD